MNFEKGGEISDLKQSETRGLWILFLITLTIIALLFISLILFVRNTPPYQIPYLTVESPDSNLIAKVFLISSDKMEGSSISVSIYDRRNKLLRDDIYRQWYCVNVAIHWDSSEKLVLNGKTINVNYESVHFVTQPTDLCPTSSTIY
ncbi:MAG: hypothetical protein E4G74_00990 [Erysipelotrichales bacterium]|nr:MAG: hypothetical protein E4G74_00990 [Erysipelotrichales bacterium]